MRKIFSNQISLFLEYLTNRGVSTNSLKFYKSDLNHFFGWLNGNEITIDRIQEYVRFLKSNFPISTINRRLSTLRNYSTFTGDKFMDGISNISLKDKDRHRESNKKIESFDHFLISQNISSNTRKNYLSDLRNYFNWKRDTGKEVEEYISEISKDSPKSTTDRKIASLRKYFEYKDYKFPKLDLSIPKEAPYSVIQRQILLKLQGLPRIQNLIHRMFFNRPKWYKRYHAYPLSNFIHIAILILFTSISGYAFYDNVIRNSNSLSAYPNSFKAPHRYLSFRGKLTDKNERQITTTTKVTFSLYDSASNGNTLWNSGSCSITPDENGIFSAVLGSTCGQEISSSVFSENVDVWMGVKVENDSEAAPRMQIATAAYALNAETLQGFPPGTDISTIPFVDSEGVLTLSANSPTIKSTSGVFGLESEALTIETADTSDGDITLNPDGNGTLNLIFEGSKPGDLVNGFINVTNANITSGALYGATVASSASGYNFVNFKSGVNPSSKFSVTSGGDIIMSGDLWVNGGSINTGDIALTIGESTTDSVTITTDGTGNGEVVLPNDSIGPNEVLSSGQSDEYCLTYEASSGGWEWQNCGSSSSVWSSLTAPVADLNLAMAANNTTFNWDPGADTNEVNFTLTTQGEDTTGGGDEDQVLLALAQTDNGNDVDEAADSLLAITNNDPNDAVNSGIRFDAGAAGTDFTYGINFSNASFGNSEIILSNSALINNTTDGILALTEPTIKLVASTSVDIDSPIIDLSSQSVDITLNNSVDSLNIDTNTLSIDAANDRVGIGTVGPDAKLDILGTSGEQLRLTYTDGSVYTSFSVDSGGDLTLDASGGDVSLGSGDNLNLTNSTNLIFGSTSLGETTTPTDSGAFLIGVNDEFDNSDSVNVQAVLNDFDIDITTALANSAIWTDSTTTTYLTTTTDDLVLGGTSPLSSAKFSIDGDSNQVQMVIQGAVGQTANLVEFQDSTSNVVASIDNSGNLSIDGDLTILGGNITSALTADSSLTVSGILTANSTFDSNGDVTIADTNISFDGASTTFTTTGAFTLTPGGNVLLGDNGDTLQIDTNDWDISTDGNLTGIGSITADGDITLTQTTPSLLLTDSDGDDYSINTNADAFTIINSTDGRTEITFDGSGAIALGSATATNITLSTDGTGNGEVVLPNDSIGPNEVASSGQSDEYCLTYEATGGAWEWQSCAGSSAWSNLTTPTGDLTLAMAANNTTFNWDPGADSAETNFVLTTQGEDTTGGGDEDQVLLALAQTDNGVNVDEATDALLTLTNNDSDDPINSAIRFDAGGAGTDFTYGINFDAADIGTAEIVLENGEQIHNQTDGSIIFEDGSGTDYLVVSSSLATLTGDLTILGGNINTGDIAFVVGDVTTDSITLSTDGTGNGEVVLPNDSIGPNEVLTTGQADEYCLTYEATGSTWEWQNCGTAASTAWSSITDPSSNLALSMAANNTTFNWDPGADTNEVNFTLTTQGEDTTGGGDEDQVLLALAQTDNGVNVDEATDALLTLTNNDSDDPINSAIRFDAGGAGTDFTYGINFDAADIGTAEIVLENGEQIQNQTDGTIVLEDGNGTDYLAVSSALTTIAGDLTVAGGNINTGDIALTIGESTTDSVTITTDGTGNGEVVLPNDSIGPNEVLSSGQSDEYCLTYEATGSTWEWQTCGSVGSNAWNDITNPTTDLTLAMGTNNTTFNWDPGADSAETAFSLTIQGEDTTGGGDEDQVLLALAQENNATNVDQAADALLTLTNNDSNDAVNSGVRFDAGDAGIDFTYGINFDAATFGTAELVLSNGATIENIADGTLTLTEPTIKLVASTSVDIDSPIIDLSSQSVDITLNNSVDSLNIDTNTLSIDAANDRVGIGTVGPDAKLDILGTSGEQLRLTYTDGSVYTSFSVDSGGDLTLDASGGDVSLGSGDNLNIGGDATVTGSDLTLGLTGVKLTGDADGAITLLGLGDGSDEDLTINLDDTSDKIVLSSSTGVNEIQFSNLDIFVGGGNINTGDIAFVVGDVTTDSITLSTDGTGNGEVVLPNDSIGPNEVLSSGQSDEYCLTYEATGGAWEWQSCQTGDGTWSGITNPTTNTTLTMATYNTTFNWDPGADSAETNFVLTTQGEDTTGGGDEDQVLLALVQTDNGTDVDQAANALLTLTNNDSNDSLVNAIRFDAGGAGTDFTYGINFDNATFGTAELVLSNGETIDNLTDGTINLGATTFKLTGGSNVVSDQSTVNLFNTVTTTLNLAGAATTINIGPSGSGSSSINLAGGSSDTGCTIDGSNGNLTCTGTLTATTGLFTTNLQVNNASATTYNRFGANTTGHAGNISTGSDLLISSDMELDGTLFIDGGTIANSAGTGTILFSATPTTTPNTLSASNWLIENTANVGQAALIVNQTKSGPLFTASASGTSRFTIANNGVVNITSTITGGSGTSTLVVSDAGGTGQGKIDVGTVDPPYTINGQKYATYMSAMVGVKEEVVGSVETSEYVPNVGFRNVIDFKNLPVASDLWLFGKTTDIKKNISKLVALLTPAAPTRVWYEIDKENKRLAIYSSAQTEISYRLTAPRFDAEKWTNERYGEEASEGFIINDPDENSSPALLTSVVNNISNSIERIQNIVSENIKTKKLEAEIISPIADSNLIIDLEPEGQKASKLAIQGKDDKEVASIDSEGNANFEGQIAASDLIVENNASVSGTLYADDIKSQRIEDIEKLLKEVENNNSLLTQAATNWAKNESTSLPDLTNTFESLTTNNLFVTSQAALSSLLVTNGLTSKSIDSLDSPLEIQSLALNPVSIMAGKVKIDTNGDAIFSGNVEVAGSLKVSNLVVADAGSQNNATDSGVITGEISSNSIAGKAVLKANSDKVRIVNPKVNNNSLIYITPLSPTQNKVLFVKAKSDGWFEVGFTEVTDSDVEFNWWIIQSLP